MQEIQKLKCETLTLDMHSNAAKNEKKAREIEKSLAYLIENEPAQLPLAGVGCPLMQIATHRVIVMGLLRQHHQLGVVYSHC